MRNTQLTADEYNLLVIAENIRRAEREQRKEARNASTDKIMADGTDSRRRKMPRV